MKKKKKWLPVMLCFTLFAAMALGSGSSDPGDTKQVVTNDNSNASDGTKTDKTENQTAEPAATPEAKVTIEKQVLVNQNDIVVTATEYVTDKIWGDGIKLLVENNSDKSVMVGCNALIVNDYMITDLFASNVAAGKKSNETLYLSSSQLKAAGIETVGKIEIYFHIYDSDTYKNIFDTECVTIQTSEFANMDTTPNDAGAELFNEGGIRIVGKTVDENSFWGSAILLYCENNSGKKVGISVNDVSINGFMMTPFFSTTIYDGKKSIEDITIFSKDLEKNGIEKIENVELKFHIYDADTHSTITDSQPITFSAQ